LPFHSNYRNLTSFGKQAEFISRSFGKTQAVSLVHRGTIDNGLAVFAIAKKDALVPDAERTSMRNVLQSKLNRNATELTPEQAKKAIALGFHVADVRYRMLSRRNSTAWRSRRLASAMS
jgi:hypothetical protein